MNRLRIAVALGLASLGVITAATVRPESRDQQGLILQAQEGQRVVRRWGPSAIAKVDPANGGSTDLVVITEVLEAGGGIPIHRHPHAEELVVVQQGEAIATVGDQRRAVTAGAMLYVPKGHWHGMQNSGREAVHVIGVFSKPGYDRYFQATSVPEGQAVTPFPPDELARVRKRFQGVIEFKEDGSARDTSPRSEDHDVQQHRK